MSLKPITLYSHAAGPNPWKVAIILEELGLPFEHKFMNFAEVKEEPYISISPNGRVPAIEDPNFDSGKGIKLWESGAIIDYLVDQYDTDGKLSYDAKDPRRYQTRVWEHFQMSGQGPYFGQLIWFTRYHAEKLPSAQERYAKEVKRVCTVINDHLKKQGTPYLTGEKLTYADLMFIPWHVSATGLASEKADMSGIDHYDTWIKSLLERPSAIKCIKERQEAIAAGK